MNSEQVVEMIASAERSRRKITTGYWYNFERQALAAMKLYRSGALGEIVHVDSVFGYDLSTGYGAAFLNNANHWIYGLPGQLLYNVLDHIVNKILCFIPDETVDVYAIAPPGDAIGGELRFMVRAERASGFGMFSSRAKPAVHSMRMYGTKNTVHVDFTARTLTFERGQVLPSALGRLFPPFVRGFDLLREGARNSWRFAKSEFGYFTGMGTLVAAFYDSILNDTAPPIPYRDMVRTSRVIEDIVAQVSPDAVPR
jgi:predicted dehydrogenase